MKIWMNVAFVAVCAVVLIVLLNAPPETTPKTPYNATHENPKEYDRCPTCHLPGGDGPEVAPDHLSPKGELVLDHAKCYMCHKPAQQAN